MKTQYITVVALGGMMAVGLMSCEDKMEGQAAAAAAQNTPPVAVTVMNVHRQDVDTESTWFGHLRGVDEANIRPEVTGKLIRQVYWDGSPCEKGEVLFEIDPEMYRATLNQAEANLVAAQAGVQQAAAADERAAKDVERYAKLISTGSISEKNYTDALQARKQTAAALAVAKAQVGQAEAQLQTARLNLERCTIRAPFTGLASGANVSVGDLLTAGGAPLTTMSSIDPIRVDFVVPGKHVLAKGLTPKFDPEKGMQSAVTEFTVIMEDGTPYELPGKVVAVDSYVNSTGTVNFVGHIPNPDMRLRSGSAVRVKAKTGVIKNALLVPSRSLVSAMNHRYIFVVGKDNAPYGIDVRLGEEVTLNMPNPDGSGTTPMLMQIVTGSVKPLEESFKEIGYDRAEDVPVIVEGGQSAALLARKNMMLRAKGAKEGYGSVMPTPFRYTHPMSTTPSVTAKQ